MLTRVLPLGIVTTRATSTFVGLDTDTSSTSIGTMHSDVNPHSRHHPEVRFVMASGATTYVRGWYTSKSLTILLNPPAFLLLSGYVSGPTYCVGTEAKYVSTDTVEPHDWC